MVAVAQLVRVPGCGPGGRRFEPGQPPQTKIRSRKGTDFFVLFTIHFSSFIIHYKRTDFRMNNEYRSRFADE